MFLCFELRSGCRCAVIALGLFWGALRLLGSGIGTGGSGVGTGWSWFPVLLGLEKVGAVLVVGINKGVWDLLLRWNHPVLV